ncbi:MAG TPA: amidase [Acidimicrobiales bacterium]|nr:amidase [Acidimicrobiales bacterium]
MTDFRRQSVAAWADDVRSGRVSSRELVQHALDRIEALDEQVNAFTAVDADAAMAAAGAIDERVARGEDVGELAGIPLAVKDLEDAAGFVTSKGSAAFADGPAAVADSVLVARLKAAGCVVVGKTNTPELGWKADTTNSVFGATRNPFSLSRSPGGSSGGSAAALAAGMVPLATGSDGGGSIRIPAALCGMPGYKPSLGRVPTGGERAPDWHHLSTRGVMARRLSDTVLALDAVIGPDPCDLRSLPMPEPAWSAALEAAHVPMKVAWSPTLGYATVDDEVRRVCESAVGVLSSLGADVVEVGSVFPDDPVWPWLQLTSTYNLRTLAAYEGTDAWERIDPGLVRTLELATGLSAVDLVRAEDVCHELNVRLVRLFHEVRVLVTPVVAGQTPVSGGFGRVNGADEANWVRFTYPFNLTRSPAGTVCAGYTADGMPVGLQLVGPQHGDLVVLRTMAALETALGLDPVPAAFPLS